MNGPSTPTDCIKLTHPLFNHYKVEVWVKLDYLNHPTIQGNKWHKLRKNLAYAKQQGYRQLLTFGGAYSNHIAATAAAGKAEQIATIGFIRGQELAGQAAKWSPTLKTAASNGMQLEFLSRADYRLKDQPTFIAQLQTRYPDAYIIPEGGSNALAVAGFDQLAQQIQQQLPNWDCLLCPVGTGGTLAGLVANLQINSANSLCPPKTQTILGVAVLKQADYLKPQIQHWIDGALKPPKSQYPINWQLLTEYHAGGYAKTPRFLQSWHKRFEKQFQIPLDPIYNNKVLYAFYKRLKVGQIPAGSKILWLHTGGLQGKQSD